MKELHSSDKELEIKNNTLKNILDIIHEPLEKVDKEFKELYEEYFQKQLLISKHYYNLISKYTDNKLITAEYTLYQMTLKNNNRYLINGLFKLISIKYNGSLFEKEINNYLILRKEICFGGKTVNEIIDLFNNAIIEVNKFEEKLAFEFNHKIIVPIEEKIIEFKKYQYYDVLEEQILKLRDSFIMESKKIILEDNKDRLIEDKFKNTCQEIRNLFINQYEFINERDSKTAFLYTQLFNKNIVKNDDDFNIMQDKIRNLNMIDDFDNFYKLYKIIWDMMIKLIDSSFDSNIELFVDKEKKKIRK